MKLTVNKWSALYLMRSLRINPERSSMLQRRTNLIAPDPSPLHRWGKGLFAEEGHTILGQLSGNTVYVAVPSSTTRLRSQHVENTVYGNGIPSGSFIEIGEGIAISSPELLFVEMAPLMHPIEHLMLGHELCGSFGRDAHDPRNGSITYGLRPLTSVKQIQQFLACARGITGIARARETLSRLNDNAWSPTESVIAAFLRCPIDDMGFTFPAIELNERVFRKQALPDSKESRVPDILIKGTNIGLNYDGLVHLDLKSVARAAFQMGANPGSQHTETELRQAMETVRVKALDDIRRNRELAVSGYTVFPVLKEDLYQPDGFDQLVARTIETLERETDLDLRAAKRALSNQKLCADRYRLLRSFLPGSYEFDVALGRYIAGFTVSDEPPQIIECLVEF